MAQASSIFCSYLCGLLSFFVVKERLSLPASFAGQVWPHKPGAPIEAAHRHDELEINLITSGRAAYLIGERRFELRRHDLVWLFPGQDHLLLNQSEDYFMWILVFKPSLVRRVSNLPQNQTLREADPPGDYCRRLATVQASRLEELYQEIRAAADDSDRYNAGLAYALSLSWAAHHAGANISPFSGIHPCVEQVARILRDDVHAPDLPGLAHRVGMSPSRLSRLFKAQTGVALADYRNRRRIEKACELLQNSRLSLQDIAEESGFGSYPQFHRIFKEKMGCSPGRFPKLRGD